MTTTRSDWDDRRGGALFRLTAQVFPPSFCAGASVLLGSYDEQVPPVLPARTLRRVASGAPAREVGVPTRLQDRTPARSTDEL